MVIFLPKWLFSVYVNIAHPRGGSVNYVVYILDPPKAAKDAPFEDESTHIMCGYVCTPGGAHTLFVRRVAKKSKNRKSG